MLRKVRYFITHLSLTIRPILIQHNSALFRNHCRYRVIFRSDCHAIITSIFLCVILLIHSLLWLSLYLSRGKKSNLIPSYLNDSLITTKTHALRGNATREFAWGRVSLREWQRTDKRATRSTHNTWCFKLNMTLNPSHTHVYNVVQHVYSRPGKICLFEYKSGSSSHHNRYSNH